MRLANWPLFSSNLSRMNAMERPDVLAVMHQHDVELLSPLCLWHPDINHRKSHGYRGRVLAQKSYHNQLSYAAACHADA